MSDLPKTKDYQGWIKLVRQRQLEAIQGKPFGSICSEHEIIKMQYLIFLGENRYWQKRIHHPVFGLRVDYINSTIKGIEEFHGRVEEFCKSIKQNAYDDRKKILRDLRTFKQQLKNNTKPKNLTDEIAIGNIIIGFLNSGQWPSRRKLKESLEFCLLPSSSSSIDRVLGAFELNETIKDKPGQGGSEVEKEEMRQKIASLKIKPPEKSSLATLTAIYEERKTLLENVEAEFREQFGNL